MSRLLLDEHPLIVLPSLAVRLGVEGAIILQQIHYWCLRVDPRPDGRRWVYNTVSQWAEQFPFWSERTVRRILSDLKAAGVLDAAEFNAARGDRTPFYAINYDAIDGVPNPSAQTRGPSGQNARMVRPERADHPRRLAASISTETTTETTAERKPFALGASGALAPIDWPDAAAFLPSTQGRDVAITDAQVHEFAAAYPAVDVRAELAKMRAWLIANPSNRKTEKGMLRFVNTWLSRAQDRAPPVRRNGSPAAPMSKTAAAFADLQAWREELGNG